MKKSLVLFAVIALIFLSACEVDQAVTGVRVQNQSESDITAVRISVTNGGLDEAPDLLSTDIPPGDFREFETGEGLFYIRVQLFNQLDVDYPRRTVVETEVITINVIDDFSL